jgi:hypothetical protein
VISITALVQALSINFFYIHEAPENLFLHRRTYDVMDLNNEIQVQKHDNHHPVLRPGMETL